MGKINKKVKKIDLKFTPNALEKRRLVCYTVIRICMCVQICKNHYVFIKLKIEKVG